LKTGAQNSYIQDGFLKHPAKKAPAARKAENIFKMQEIHDASCQKTSGKNTGGRRG
jgi:hypothetical protein